MKLLEVDENHNVKPNKEWLILIPEFAALYKRDKGSKGDYDGRAKLRFKREISFIFFATSFTSPLRDWQPEEKFEEALIYSELKAEEIDDLIKAACDKYEELQLKSSRAYRTYLSLKKGLDAMDKYYETVDFTAKNGRGELINDTKTYTASVIQMDKVYDALSSFEKKVDADLKDADGGIRGQATLGDLEARKTGVNHTWSEEEVREGAKRARGAVVKSMDWRTIEKNVVSKIDKPLNEFDNDELSSSG
jgi:hypothetical protein